MFRRARDGYECYERDRKLFTINPHGEHYEVTSSKSWDWTFKLIVGVDMGEVFNLTAAGLLAQNPISYAVSFEVAQLPKDYNGVAGGARYLDAT